MKRALSSENPMFTNCFYFCHSTLPEVYPALKSSDGATLCHVASFLNKPDHVTAILFSDRKRGSEQDDFNSNSLQIAIEMQHQETLTALLRHGIFSTQEKNVAYDQALKSKHLNTIWTFYLHATEKGWVPPNH